MTEKWIKVALAADVPEDGTLPVQCASIPVCLYNLGGAIYATHDLCTHGEASLAEGFITGENIECALHQGQFHIPTGKAVGVPCVVDLKVFPVKIKDGEVYVDCAGEQAHSD